KRHKFNHETSAMREQLNRLHVGRYFAAVGGVGIDYRCCFAANSQRNSKHSLRLNLSKPAQETLIFRLMFGRAIESLLRAKRWAKHRVRLQWYRHSSYWSSSLIQSTRGPRY